MGIARRMAMYAGLKRDLVFYDSSTGTDNTGGQAKWTQYKTNGSMDPVDYTKYSGYMTVRTHFLTYTQGVVVNTTPIDVSGYTTCKVTYGSGPSTYNNLCGVGLVRSATPVSEVTWLVENNNNKSNDELTVTLNISSITGTVYFAAYVQGYTDNTKEMRIKKILFE